MEIIIKIFAVYWGIATFILLNLLFNPRVRLVWVDPKTKQTLQPPYWIFILICMYWIFIIPYSIFKSGREK